MLAKLDSGERGAITYISTGDKTKGYVKFTHTGSSVAASAGIVDANGTDTGMKFTEDSSSMYASTTVITDSGDSVTVSLSIVVTGLATLAVFSFFGMAQDGIFKAGAYIDLTFNLALITLTGALAVAAVFAGPALSGAVGVVGEAIYSFA